MKSDLSIPTPGMLFTPGLFYSSSGRNARVLNGNTRLVIGKLPNSSSRANRFYVIISTDDGTDMVNPNV
ncbi:MAG: hypothetical protein NTY15_21000 [Planctomycetota bacterium]|nr:hypothetical protein [Planctomycetota bacterium]